MICAVCEKESNNKRVCPYCFTPYPSDEGAGSKTGASARASTQSLRLSTQAQRVSAAQAAAPNLLQKIWAQVRAFVMRQTPVVRWSGAGIVFVLLLLRFTPSDEVTFEPGSVPSNIIASPMQRDEALALLRRTRETALVEEQGNDEVFVSYPAATFPLRTDGQIALAQQYARADEIVSGRKRRIFFYNPNAKVFAQADPLTGVTVVR